MMRARLVSRMALLLVAAWFASVPASAQSTATVQGAVTDTQGAVMPGVTVTIHNTATGIERSVVTSSAGEYVAPSLPPGHYALVAHLEGFQDQKLEIDAGPAQTVAANFRLGVAALAENVTVAGVSPLIETSSVSVGQVMQEKTVQE